MQTDMPNKLQFKNNAGLHGLHFSFDVDDNEKNGKTQIYYY